MYCMSYLVEFVEAPQDIVPVVPRYLLHKQSLPVVRI